MSKLNEVWEKLVWITKKLSNARIRTSKISGNFFVEDDADLNALVLCSEFANETGLYVENYIEDNINKINVGQEIYVEINPKPVFGILAENIDSFLSFNKVPISEPQNFYILYEEENLIDKYRSVLKYINILRDVALGLDDVSETLIFFKEKRFVIPILYGGHELKELNVNDIEFFSELLNKPGQEIQTKEILATTLIEATENYQENERFSYILRNLSEIINRFDESYRTLISGFTYEKIKNEIEIARVEYANKIHKVLTDIQNQLIGIPLAAMIGVTQMKEAILWDYQFWVNSIILVACVSVFFVLFILVTNQFYTLNIIKGDIEKQKQKLKNEYPLNSKDIVKGFNDLIKRAGKQKILLGIICFITIVCFLGITAIYISSISQQKDPVVENNKNISITKETK